MAGLKNTSQKPLIGRTDGLVDSAWDVELNGVRLPDGTVVSWAKAFPRP